MQNPDLPKTRNIEEIKIHLSAAFRNIALVDSSGRSLSNLVKDIINSDSATIRTGNFATHETFFFEHYSVRRLSHQLNEACNKLAACLELVNIHHQGEKVFKTFSKNFISGTLIPTLYYSQISAMVAILCGFGCISFRHYKTDGNYFLIRINNGWVLRERSTYIRKTLGKTVKGWHAEAITSYETLKELGYELPGIDISKVNSLKTERNRYHYYILGDLSMYGYYGLKPFFEHVPLVLQTIHEGLRILNAIQRDRVITNRFDDIINNIGIIYKNCGEDASFLSSFKDPIIV